MANLLTVEHVSAGEHVQLATLNEPLRTVVMPYGKRRVFGVNAPAGSHFDLKTSGGPLAVVTSPTVLRGHLSVLASTVVGPGQSVQLETPMGTLAAVGWDPELAGDELTEDGDPVDPIAELAGGGELSPPTRP